MCHRLVVVRVTTKGSGVLVNCKNASPFRWVATRSSPAISGDPVFGRQTAWPSRIIHPGSARLAAASGGTVWQAPQPSADTNQNNECNLLRLRELRPIV